MTDNQQFINKDNYREMQAIYETDQEQEANERGTWKRGGTPRPASVWRWMEYGVFDGVGSMLYMKLYLRKLIDEGTGSTFNALESRGFIKCKYTLGQNKPLLFIQCDLVLV